MSDFDEKGGDDQVWRNRTMTVLQKAVLGRDGDGGASASGAIEGETSDWKVLVVPPDLVYAIERTFSAWLGMVIWIYVFGTLLLNANPALAAAGLQVRLGDGLFNLGVIFSLFGILMLGWHTYVYERRTRMFKGSQKYFNRLGIYVVVITLACGMLVGIVADIVYGSAKVIQTAPA